MRLTPVILSFNHPELTARCVTSVLEHFPDCPQVYLVHNGSQAATQEILRQQFPNIRHIELSENRGFSGGANRGLGEAFRDGAENVFFLTNDTTLEKIPTQALFEETLKRKGALLNGDRGFLLAPRIERRQTGKIDSVGGKVNLFTGSLRHLQFFEDQIPKNFYVPGTAFILSREAWQKVGPFNEELGTYWEDVDLSLRARQKGVWLGASPEVVLKHGVGKTCHKSPLYTVFYFHRNRRKVVWLHSNLIGKILFSAVYGASTLGKSFKFLKNKDIPRLKWLLRSLIS